MPSTFGFAAPAYLWLLAAPALLLLLWGWQALRRRIDARRAARRRVLPARDRYAALGDLPFWLCLTIAGTLCLLALARPQAIETVAGTTGADFVILLDGSASMYTRDVAPDRWRRAIRFVRSFADSLSWKQDRVGLALFAHFAAPQVRLTKDPNALLFFLEHLSTQSPFRLEDDPTWNTNIEQGVTWGLRLIETNEQLFGKTNNPKTFIVVSDGQAWTGRAATALAAARAADVAVQVIGVGTTTGGFIPQTAGDAARASAIRAVLDRESLRTIAAAGRGQYFEIGRQSDRQIAEQIIAGARRRAPAAPREELRQELYWRFLLAAAVFLCLGTFAIGQRSELWWEAAAAVAAVALLAIVAG